MAASTHVVWYLRGRGQYGIWHHTIAYPSQAAAQESAAGVERMGYPCVVAPEGSDRPSDTDPAWWDYSRLRRVAGVPGDAVPVLAAA